MEGDLVAPWQFCRGALPASFLAHLRLKTSVRQQIGGIPQTWTWTNGSARVTPANQSSSPSSSFYSGPLPAQVSSVSKHSLELRYTIAPSRSF